MQFSNLTISELKVIATELDCTLKGDKRAKQSWINAIELAQHLETLVAPAGETEAEWEVRASECIGLGEVLDEIINGTDADEHVSTDYVDMPEAPTQQETPNSQPPTKKGAIAVIAPLLCIIFAIGVAGTIVYQIVKYTIVLASMFGRYNPDLDLWYQLTNLAEGRELQPLIVPV